MPRSIADDVAMVQRISAVPAILQILSDTTGLGFAAIARVTEDSWTACAVLDRIGFGLRPGGELEVATTLCRVSRATREPIIIEKVSENPQYCGHPTPRMYGFESYVAVPIIRRDGDVFGTICAIDPRPASLPRGRLLPTLRLFAELVATQIELEERLETSRSALVDATQVAAVRDQFIAVLGHDLRNPIAAVSAGLDLLERRPLEERAKALVGPMRRSVRRMTELADNLLDMARGRLGGGIPIQRQPAVDLAATLEHVIAELQGVHPGHPIRTAFDLRVPIACDPQRIAQLLSNLLANALVHGAPGGPVEVAARSDAAGLTLSVTNGGRPIPPAALARLFQPFARDPTDLPRAGLGLGLYIAAEIARSHGGQLEARSDEAATVFTLTLPAGPAEAGFAAPVSL